MKSKEILLGVLASAVVLIFISGVITNIRHHTAAAPVMAPRLNKAVLVGIADGGNVEIYEFTDEKNGQRFLIAKERYNGSLTMVHAEPPLPVAATIETAGSVDLIRDNDR